MRKKTGIVLGVGCGGVLVLFVVVVIALVSFVPKTFEWAEQQISAEQDRRELADNWQPPENDASSETFFPPKVANYELSLHDEETAIPEFRFDLSGRHAVYQSGASQIDVFIYQVSELEKEALFGRVHDIYEEQTSGFKRITDMGYRCFYSSSQHHQNHFWWTKGWLLVFRTQDSEDREPFVKMFLQGTTEERAAETP